MMPTSLKQEYRARATKLLREEIQRKKMTHEKLSTLLDQQGYDIGAKELTAKLDAGDFSAAFLLICLTVIDAKYILLSD